MCKYCEGGEPLTDKVFEDGGKFDNMMSTRISFLGRRPMLICQTKQAAFAPGLVKQYGPMIEKSWAVDIEYCPKCGRKITAPEG